MLMMHDDVGADRCVRPQCIAMLFTAWAATPVGPYAMGRDDCHRWSVVDHP
jgi:hypothetical protein